MLNFWEFSSEFNNHKIDYDKKNFVAISNKRKVVSKRRRAKGYEQSIRNHAFVCDTVDKA